MNTQLIHKTVMQRFYSLGKKGAGLLPGRECAFVLHVIFLPLFKNKQKAGAASTFQEQADGRRTTEESKGMSRLQWVFFLLSPCRAYPQQSLVAKALHWDPGAPCFQTCCSDLHKWTRLFKRCPYLMCKTGMRNVSFFFCLFILLTFRAGTSSGIVWRVWWVHDKAKPTYLLTVTKKMSGLTS